MKHFMLTILWASSLGTAHLQAGQFVLIDFDRGWYRSNGDHIPSNLNTFTGANAQGLHNSFLVFDLKEIEQPVYSVVLCLGIASYQSQDPSEPIAVYDISTPINLLTNSPATTADGVVVFEDLQSGSLYASGNAVENEVVALQLSALAVAAINSSANGSFAVAIHPLEVKFIDGSANGFTLNATTTKLIVNTHPAEVTLQIQAEGRISWESEEQVSYQVQYSSLLADPMWFDLGSAVIGDGSVIEVNDTFNLPQRYYRVVATTTPFPEGN